MKQELSILLAGLMLLCLCGCAAGDSGAALQDAVSAKEAGVAHAGRSVSKTSAENAQTTTQAGDIVLYQGDQIVLFYGSNSWSYTRLGKIDNLTEWAEALGGGDLSVTFSLQKP